jgi:DNA-directed RNA polymerase subunit RPC12/RpoP
METSDSSGYTVRCPHCRTTRLRVREKLDPIERVHGNKWLNRIRAARGDFIYHCIYCRLQFYDWHKPSPGPEPGSSADIMSPDAVQGGEQCKPE